MSKFLKNFFHLRLNERLYKHQYCISTSPKPKGLIENWEIWDILKRCEMHINDDTGWYTLSIAMIRFVHVQEWLQMQTHLQIFVDSLKMFKDYFISEKVVAVLVASLWYIM